MTTPQALVIIAPVIAFPWVLRRILYSYSLRHGTYSLKPIIPVLAILCWTLWITTAVFLVVNRFEFRGLASLFLALYGGILTVFHYAKGEAAFESPRVVSPLPSSVLRVPAEIYVSVGNPRGLSDWYVEKLGMRRLAESVGGNVGLKFGLDGESIILEPSDPSSKRSPLVLFTSRIKKARSVLTSRGISVGEIETDRQGTRYFEFRDPEGNSIDVSEEPAGALGGEIL
jgi:catechol 2,3-dioxygenase-like lactoylglutathione lyase family enzyme